MIIEEVIFLRNEQGKVRKEVIPIFLTHVVIEARAQGHVSLLTQARTKHERVSLRSRKMNEPRKRTSFAQ